MTSLLLLPLAFCALHGCADNPPYHPIVDCKLAGLVPDDGDSFFCGETYIRVLGLDTPETKHPAHGLLKDQAYGPEASKLAEEIFRKADSVVAVFMGTDIYGRTLAHVFVDGQLFAEKMIAAGLAYETISRYGSTGFPILDKALVDAGKRAGPLPFINPSVWRRTNRVKTAK